MAIINEDRMNARLNKWSGGSMALAVAVALVVGFVVHMLFF